MKCYTVLIFMRKYFFFVKRKTFFWVINIMLIFPKTEIKNVDWRVVKKLLRFDISI